MNQRQPESGKVEFHDPLENYDPPDYDDALLEALCEQPVTAIRTRPCTTINEEMPIHEAIRLLVGNDIACALVTDSQDKLVGVFSDRDVQDKVALEYASVKDHPVREFMTRPVYVRDHDSAAAAVGVMASTGYRHIPVVDGQERVVGIVGPQRTAAFLERYFERNAT